MFDAPDLSPEEFADHVARGLARALESTGLIEVKEMKTSVGQCHFFGRVHKKNLRAWSRLTKKLLVAMEGFVDGFVGRQEIVTLKNGAPKNSKNPDDYIHKFGHLVSVGSNDLKGAADMLAQIIVEASPRKHVEVMEYPMLGSGAPQSGGIVTGRKGAHLTSGAPK